MTSIVIMINYLEKTLKKELNNKKHNTVLQFLLHFLKNDKLSHGAINVATIKCNVHHTIIPRL